MANELSAPLTHWLAGLGVAMDVARVAAASIVDGLSADRGLGKDELSLARAYLSRRGSDASLDAPLAAAVARAQAEASAAGRGKLSIKLWGDPHEDLSSGSALRGTKTQGAGAVQPNQSNPEFLRVRASRVAARRITVVRHARLVNYR